MKLRISSSLYQRTDPKYSPVTMSSSTLSRRPLAQIVYWDTSLPQSSSGTHICDPLLKMLGKCLVPCAVPGSSWLLLLCSIITKSVQTKLAYCCHIWVQFSKKFHALTPISPQEDFKMLEKRSAHSSPPKKYLTSSTTLYLCSS